MQHSVNLYLFIVYSHSRFIDNPIIIYDFFDDRRNAQKYLANLEHENAHIFEMCGPKIFEYTLSYTRSMQFTMKSMKELWIELEEVLNIYARDAPATRHKDNNIKVLQAINRELAQRYIYLQN
jgi:hypothetical protein